MKKNEKLNMKKVFQTKAKKYKEVRNKFNKL